MTAEEQQKCMDCEYGIDVCANSKFRFRGCTYGLYKGKWVAEIDCPKRSEEE